MAYRVAHQGLKHHYPQYISYSFTERGSDESQYCSPGVELPVVGISRKKYGTYPEYHTFLDNLYLISPSGLEGGYSVVKKIIQTLERNAFYRSTLSCEPQYSKTGLYPNLSTKNQDYKTVVNIMNFMAYANGKRDLIEIANKTNSDITAFFELIDQLKEFGLVVVE